MRCDICNEEIENGEKAYQDNYFFRVTCSYECHLRAFEEDFGLTREPNIYIENNSVEYFED